MWDWLGSWGKDHDNNNNMCVSSHLFCRKIESLFPVVRNINGSSAYSDEGESNTTANSSSTTTIASTNPLFKCLNCKKVFSTKSESLFDMLSIKDHHQPWSRSIVESCPLGEQTIDMWGQVSCPHTRDPSFDVNEYVAEIYVETNSWIKTFWR